MYTQALIEAIVEESAADILDLFQKEISRRCMQRLEERRADIAATIFTEESEYVGEDDEVEDLEEDFEQLDEYETHRTSSGHVYDDEGNLVSRPGRTSKSTSRGYAGGRGRNTASDNWKDSRQDKPVKHGSMTAQSLLGDKGKHTHAVHYKGKVWRTFASKENAHKAAQGFGKDHQQHVSVHKISEAALDEAARRTISQKIKRARDRMMWAGRKSTDHNDNFAGHNPRATKNHVKHGSDKFLSHIVGDKNKPTKNSPADVQRKAAYLELKRRGKITKEEAELAEAQKCTDSERKGYGKRAERKKEANKVRRQQDKMTD